MCRFRLRCGSIVAEIALERVTKVYPDGTKAVAELDMEVGDGELVVFVGPSGCGKTSALRMIAGLEDITEERSGSAATSSTTCRRRTATWRWSSRTTRSTRT